jgi:hypothetical protein
VFTLKTEMGGKPQIAQVTEAEEFNPDRQENPAGTKESP